MALQSIGKYELLEELGRGGFAVVYKARDTTLDRVVALKVLHPHWAADPGFSERFRQEARAAANLRHANIVTVYEAGEADGQLFIAMEYLPGRTLHDLLEAEGALSLDAALPILEQIADALDYAHGQGVIHRDVKPLNVMVEQTARDPNATLMDFGLVKALETSTALTSQGTLLGSPEYMAPEQADPNRKDEIGPATDRYALGILAYRMLAGRVPFPGNTPGTLNAHMNLNVPDPRRFVQDLPPAVAEALLEMLAKAPAERFSTAGAFVGRLREVQEAEQQRRAREVQLAMLHTQLQAATARQDWPEVLQVGGQIQALQPDNAEAVRWIVQARKQLRCSALRAFIVRSVLLTRRSLPVWGKSVVISVVAVILLVVLLGVIVPPVAGPLFVRSNPTLTLTLTLTPMPSPSQTATPIPSPSLTAMPMLTPPPTATATPIRGATAIATSARTRTATATFTSPEPTNTLALIETPTTTPHFDISTLIPTKTPLPTVEPAPQSTLPASDGNWVQFTSLYYEDIELINGTVIKPNGIIHWQITGIAPDRGDEGAYYTGTDAGLLIVKGDQTEYIQPSPSMRGCWRKPGELWGPTIYWAFNKMCGSATTTVMQIDIRALPAFAVGEVQITPSLRVWRRENIGGQWTDGLDEHWESGATVIVNIQP